MPSPILPNVKINEIKPNALPPLAHTIKKKSSLHLNASVFSLDIVIDSRNDSLETPQLLMRGVKSPIKDAFTNEKQNSESILASLTAQPVISKPTLSPLNEQKIKGESLVLTSTLKTSSELLSSPAQPDLLGNTLPSQIHQ